MGTGSFPGVKQSGRGVDHPPPSSGEVKERVELYLYSPSGPSWPVLGYLGSRTVITVMQFFQLTMFMAYIFHEIVISWLTSRTVLCKRLNCGNHC
jgi:hypothetical protein